MITKFLNIKRHKIAYFECTNTKAKYGVIIVHGLAEHKGRYIDFAKKLVANNVCAFAMDLRGHGESGGTRGDAKNYKQLLTDLDFFIKHIKYEYPHLKLILFGHSMGGQICFNYCGKYESDGLILSNPPLQKHKESKRFTAMPYKLLGFIKIKNKIGESSQMPQISKNDKLTLKAFSFRLIGIIFKEGIGLAVKNAHNIKCPLLMLLGRIDPLVDYNTSKTVFEKVASQNKTLKIYDTVKHRVVQNEGSEARINDIIAWIFSLKA